MGQLTEHGFLTSTVKTPKGEIVLRGLSGEDVLRIARGHMAIIEKLFKKFAVQGAEGDVSFEFGKIRDVVIQVLEGAPEVAAELIAYAADDPDAVAIVRKFPITLQIECLDKIGEMTFAMEGGAKKFVETVERMLRGTNDLLGELRGSVTG